MALWCVPLACGLCVSLSVSPLLCSVLSAALPSSWTCSSHISSHHRLEEDLWWGFLGGSDGRECTCNIGDQGLIPGLGRSLEKEMATHSSIFAWEIPWTEEPGRLSMGSQRVGLDWATNPVSGSSHHLLCGSLCVPVVYPTPVFPGSSRTFAATLICRSSHLSLLSCLTYTVGGHAFISHHGGTHLTGHQKQRPYPELNPCVWCFHFICFWELHLSHPS